LQKEAGPEARDQLALAFRLLTGRHGTAAELEVLEAFRHGEEQRFKRDPEAATALLSTGDHPGDETLQPAKTAALAMTANLLMNHDEFYMKR